MKLTLVDIAKMANVSKMTVSRVLSGKGPVAAKTKAHILKIVDELNYQPNLIARSLASKQTMILGIIIPKIEHMLLDNYIAQVISGITDIAMQNNYRIMLCPFEPEQQHKSEYMNIARSKLITGMILVKTKYDDPNITDLADHGFPFVLVNHKKYSKKINFVDSRNIEGAKIAVNYLYEKGHKEIAFVAGSMDETNGKDRYKGYVDAMKKLGLPFRPEWVVNGDFNKEKAYIEAKKLIKPGKKPTAIFCSDDYMALGVIQHIKEVGLTVPDDIAIIGFDDIELASYTKPALTTIRQPIYDLGKTAAEILLNLIDNKTTSPVHKLLNVELVKRESA